MIEELLTLVNQNWGVVCNANIVNVLIYLNLIFFIQPVNKSNEWQLDLFIFFISVLITKHRRPLGMPDSSCRFTK